MNNGISPYQRRNEYYSVLKTGDNIQKIKKTIQEQSEKMLQAQLLSANEIVASNNTVNNSVESLKYDLKQVSNGIYGLQSAFEWGISEFIWQIEQNREILKETLQTLKSPHKTEAEEYKEWANDCFNKGFYDDAIEYFNKSLSIYKQDFSIYISLGMIYYFNLKNSKLALQNFEKAIKYSKPISNYYTSYSLLYKSLILQQQGNIVIAEKLTEEAIDLSPDFSQVIYENTKQNAILKKREKVLKNFDRLVKLNKLYILQMHQDSEFDNMIEIIDERIKKIRGENYNITKSKYKKVNEKKQDLKILIKDVIENNKLSDVKNDFNKIEEELERIDTLILGNSLLDSFSALKLISVVEEDLKKIAINSKHKIYDLLSTTRSFIKSSESRIRNLKMKKSKYWKYFWFSFIGTFFLYGLIVSIILMVLVLILFPTIPFGFGFFLFLLFDSLISYYLSKKFKGEAIYEVKKSEILNQKNNIKNAKELIPKYEQLLEKLRNNG